MDGWHLEVSGTVFLVLGPNGERYRFGNRLDAEEELARNQRRPDPLARLRAHEDTNA